MTKQPKDPIGSLSFEQAIAELETIVTRLEKGGEKLEDTIRDYERGEQLRKHCSELLSKVEKRIELIQKEDETYTTTSFSPS